MRNRVFISLLVSSALNFIGVTSYCQGGDYKLNIDMNASQKKIISREVVQTRAPASTSRVDVYSVGFNREAPLFPKDFPHETNRTYRAPHPVGFQNPIGKTNMMFSLYLMPFTRKTTTPFGDTSSQLTQRSFYTTGITLGYLF